MTQETFKTADGIVRKIEIAESKKRNLDRIFTDFDQIFDYSPNAAKVIVEFKGKLARTIDDDIAGLVGKLNEL